LQSASVAGHAQQAVVAAAPAAASLVLDKLPEAERVTNARCPGLAAQAADRVGHGRGRRPAEHRHDDHAAAQLRAGHVDRPQRPAVAVTRAQRVRGVLVLGQAAATVVRGRGQAPEKRQRRPGQQPAQRLGRGRLVLTLAVGQW